MAEKPIGIIGAMAAEVEALLAAMQEEKVEEFSGLAFHSGTLEGVACVVAECGPGKVNAAVCAQTMVLRYSPRLVINVGVAGGVGPQVHIGDLVVAAACVQYDFDTTAMGDPLGTLFIRRASGENEDILLLPCCEEAAGLLLEEARSIYGGAHFGVICTGDVFVADAEKNQFLQEKFEAHAVEMEGAPGHFRLRQRRFSHGFPSLHQNGRRKDRKTAGRGAAKAVKACCLSDFVCKGRTFIVRKSCKVI